MNARDSADTTAQNEPQQLRVTAALAALRAALCHIAHVGVDN